MLPDSGQKPARLDAEHLARGPMSGLLGHDQYYATRLKQLAHLEMPESQAAELWQNVARHRRLLFRRLGRDVGQRVALLDYIVNVKPQLIEPQIIERTTLEAIEHRAIADSLTGLYNRHYFETQLALEAQRSRRYGAVTSLALIDLDLFKEVNDEYGHRVGDLVLSAVGALIIRHIRAADVACRYGGDEFAIILPETLEGDATIMAERIRTDIETWFETNPVSGIFVAVTASCGVGTPVPGMSSSERLFREADWALYEAKRAGGNRVSRPVPHQLEDERPSAD